MSYASLIAENTGTTDAATVALIEELMRADRPALDALTHSEFIAAIGQACADAAELAATGMLVYYCHALGLAVPSPWTA
jgi:hypothetical protein